MSTDDADQTRTDQLVLQHPGTRYPRISPPEQRQSEPGLEAAMTPQPDIGEHSYRGTGRLDYASTKASINNFTKGLAQQLAEKGIRVNAVAPGPIWTVLQPSGGQPTEELPEFGRHTALGRAGQPTEVAPAYVFLASPESSYVLGETLNVNGGTPTP